MFYIIIISSIIIIIINTWKNNHFIYFLSCFYLTLNVYIKHVIHNRMEESTWI